MFRGGRKTKSHLGIGFGEMSLAPSSNVEFEVQQDALKLCMDVLEATSCVTDLSREMLKKQRDLLHQHNCQLALDEQRRIMINSYSDNVVNGVIVNAGGDQRINYYVTTNPELQVFTISVHDQNMPYGGETYEYRTTKHGDFKMTEVNVTDGRGNMTRAINGDRRRGLAIVNQIIIPELGEALATIDAERIPATIG